MEFNLTSIKHKTRIINYKSTSPFIENSNEKFIIIIPIIVADIKIE